MKGRRDIAVFFLILAATIIIAGCTQKTQETAIETIAGKETSVKEELTKEEPLEKGPGGCASDAECMSYCSKNPFDCKAWCESNSEACEKRGIRIDIPSGIPNSPCTSDSECISGLICLDFKCSIPSPDNMAKKSGFRLPGGCQSMSDCGQFCAKPENHETCKSFCENFPSFCGELSGIKAATAPEECRECTKCEQTSEPKNCILDCTYNCFAYMPFEKQNVEQLKKGAAFERKYQTPIKAVWEPGPANNRNGIKYFADYYKELGINTYSITPKYNHKDGRLIHEADYVIGEKAADNEKTASMIQAKKAGFQVVLAAHDLYDMFPDVSGKDPGLKPSDYYDDIEATALKWAQVAEDYKAEYFAPVNEFEYVLYENGYPAEEACRITNDLYKKIIPKVKEIYKGKIYCRVGGMDAKFGCMDFSGCDIFGFTYGFSGGEPRKNFDTAFEEGEKASKKYGKPYIMAEAFSFNTEGYDACSNLHLAGIESYKANAKSGIGYTFMGVVQRDPIKKNDCPIIHPQVKDKLVPAYKEFFKWMDENQEGS